MVIQRICKSIWRVYGVLRGKSEMYKHLSQNDKFVFVNLEDPIQVEKQKI
jgi:UDP-N-acetylmuramoyl-tripeptide--D-alanyl-D-alanine ligase